MGWKKGMTVFCVTGYGGNYQITPVVVLDVSGDWVIVARGILLMNSNDDTCWVPSTDRLFQTYKDAKAKAIEIMQVEASALKDTLTDIEEAEATLRSSETNMQLALDTLNLLIEQDWEYATAEERVANEFDMTVDEINVLRSMYDEQ